MMATIGRIHRFPTPRQLVGYVGLDARVRQSGNHPARHGRISKQGASAARHVLVQAAWAAIKTPGPLHAFYRRVKAPPRRADRDRRRRAQARDPHLAPAHQATGLRLPTPAARRPQAPPARAPDRRPATPRTRSPAPEHRPPATSNAPASPKPATPTSPATGRRTRSGLDFLSARVPGVGRWRPARPVGPRAGDGLTH